MSAFEFGGTMDSDGDPEYVYYNALITNNRTDLNRDLPDPQVRFQETRGVPIIKDASKYVFSIVRANMNGPGKDLPIFIPKIRIGPTDNPAQNVNLTVYSITHSIEVKYTVGPSSYSNSFSSTVPIIWSPEVLDLDYAPVPQPSSTVTGQDVSTRYYYCFTYTHWLKLVNNAFATAVSNIQTAFNAWWVASAIPGPAPTLGTAPCYMTYNPTSNLFSLYASRYSFGYPNNTSEFTNAQERSFLYFNNNMYGLFSNFGALYVNLSSERIYEIQVFSVLFQNILNVATTGKSYWIMIQDYESTSTLWSPVESIVFTSTMLPLVFEQTGDPVRFGDSIVGTTDTQVAFSPIITDIAVTNTSASDYRGFIQYIPSAEYRLTAFQRSKAPIYNVDIQVFWKNRLDGQLYPVTMFNGSSVSAKMMFRRVTP